MTSNRLPPEEIEDLRREMQAASAWFKAELAKPRVEPEMLTPAELEALRADKVACIKKAEKALRELLVPPPSSCAS